MLSESITRFLSLYHSHTVKAVLAGGQVVCGTLLTVGVDRVEIEGTAYGVEQLEDIIYVGTLTDYHTFGNSGVIDKAYQFKLEDCLNPEEFAPMIYHEYECRVSCHLEIRENAIQAVDVSVLQRTHVMNADILTKDCFLYTFADGRRVVGTLQNTGGSHSLLTDKGERILFADDEVTDITRAPMINDFVTVRTDDGTESRGIVSAAQEEYILIIADMLPKMVFYKNLVELRYHGIITENGIIDSVYQYKPPFYLKDKSGEAFLSEGAKVSYIAGINGRYRIAKEIVLEEAAEKMARGELDHYGVILMVDMDPKKPEGVGYIGSEYRSKVCGEQPKGNVRFKRSQLPFEYDYNKIFVVRYSLRSEEPNRIATLAQMELVEAVDYAETGIVRVGADGNIETIPVYRAVPKYYTDRNVDVVCHTGVCSGTLLSQEPDGVLLQTEDEKTERIPYAEIENIRIKGKVSQYNSNGMGYIDNIYFFHINDISNVAVATRIHEGVLLSFELHNTRKAAGYYCADIDVIGETLDGYAISYQDGILTVADEEEYSKNPESAGRYSIYMEENESFPELDKYDYRATFTLQVNENKLECISVRVREGRPKSLDGYATALDAATIRIATAKQYEEGSGNLYLLSNRLEVKAKLNNIDRYDYVVKYRVFDGNTVEVTFVGEAREKVFFGYIDTYYNDRQFGYITPREYYGKKTFVERLKENIDIWCRPGAFKNAPTPLDTSLNSYYVRYTLDYSVQDVKAPAKEVMFLDVCGKNQKVAAPVAASAQEVVMTFKKEKLDLAAEYGAENKNGQKYIYRIMAAYSAYFDVIRLNEVYQNKKYYEEGFAFSEQEPIVADSEKITVQSEDKIATAKYAYIVRFVGGEGEGELAINYDYPLEVVGRYSKKQVRSLSVHGFELELEAVERQMKTVAQTAMSEEKEVNPDFAPQKVQELDQGETFLYKTKDMMLHLAEFDYAEDGKLHLVSGEVLEAAEVSEENLYRFGVLADFDSEFQSGFLNGSLRVSLSVLENKTFNIAKTAKKKMLVAYRTENGYVSRVEKLSEEMTAQLLWSEGTLNEYIDNDKFRVLLFDGDVTHYLSVLTDGLVSRMAKKGMLTGKQLFIKKLNCPVWNETGDADPVTVAAEVHCMEEAESEIRYDAVQDKYMAYRDQTHSAPIRGKISALQEAVGKKITVYFAPDSSMKLLEAWVEKNFTEEAAEQEHEESGTEQSTTITNSVLGRYCLRQVDLRQSVLPKWVNLNKEGWPESKEQAIDLIVDRCSGNTVPSANLFMAAAVAERLDRESQNIAFNRLAKNSKFHAGSLERLVRLAFRRRAEEIFCNANGNLGEYTYYVTTLLRESQGVNFKKENLYRLFLQDFKDRLNSSTELSGESEQGTLEHLFEQEWLPENAKTSARQVIAHIMFLDEQSAEYLFHLGVIQKNAALVQTILELGEEIEKQHFEDPIDCLKLLRADYQRDKQFYAKPEYLGGDLGGGCGQWYDALIKISQRFAKLMCEDDATRFSKLAGCCKTVVENQTSGYRESEKNLSEAYREICELIEDVKEHPTQQAFELLLKEKLMERVRVEIARELDELYQYENSVPLLICRQNSSEVLKKPGENPTDKEKVSVCLLVENGNEDFADRQSAQDVVFYFQMLTEDDISVISELRLPQGELKPGRENRCELVVPLEIGEFEGESFEIQWSATYSYIGAFDGQKVRQSVEMNGQVLKFQLYQAMPQTEKRNVSNPYTTPSGGKALVGADEMFFGRKAELGNIWEWIVSPEEELISGRAVIVYGQKRSGKTSLINQIKNRLKTQEKFKEQSIVLHIEDMGRVASNVEELEKFHRNFYNAILRAFRRELRNEHKEVDNQLRENGLSIPDLKERENGEYIYDLDAFFSFFEDFEDLTEGRYKIVLIMDEMTKLCNIIMMHLNTDSEFQKIPEFIKFLSDLGFIQIVVGHAAMMASFGKLGVLNSTAARAKVIEISALEKEDCRDIVRKPMKKNFGFDVYGTVLGEDAVNKLLELSGCSPFVLMKLCNEMFRYFVDKMMENYIEPEDVASMVDVYVETLDAGYFDMLLKEDEETGTSREDMNMLPEYFYLECISEESWKSNNHDCDAETVCMRLASGLGLTPEKELEAARIKSDEMRETLISRRVISMKNGRIKLIMWLFAEYWKKKNGKQ